MPATPSTSIHTLNSDILVHIFTINADMFSDTLALHTTCVASQVCRQWRECLLNTSSLWAKLIDIDMFHYSAPIWWDEVVRRGSVAPLWVKVKAHPYYIRSHTGAFPASKSAPLQKFFADLIRGNWYRIQKLVVQGDTPIMDFGLSPSMLSLPAPQLEEFTAPLAIKAGEVPTIPIFADHAPMLRRLHLMGYADSQRATWLRHLHFLELSDMYSIRSALEVLIAIPNLREFRVAFLKPEALSVSPVVSLPHLKHLQCDGHPQPFSVLLNHVTIPLTCSVAVRILPKVDCTLDQILSVIDTFAHYAERYLQSHEFDAIRFCYEPHSIDLRHKATSTGCYLNILIPISADFLDIFLDHLARLDFSRFTKFIFHSKCPLDLRLGSLFSCLSLVDTITADTQTLRYLMELEDNMITTSAEQPHLLFPLLKVIKLHMHSFDTRILRTNQIEDALEYALSRTRIGHPITMLDAATDSPLPALPNFDMHPELKGLTVRYRFISTVTETFVHICGSGDPDKRIDMT